MAASFILLVLAPFAVYSLANGKSNDLPYIVEAPEKRPPCDEMEVIKWTSEFHGCFMDRKYKDGGRNLETIVDRILQHAELCVETSVRPCQPDFQGFQNIMNKTISQIKDYSEMYLSEIYKGKENFKDVDCVERILSLESYTKCFRTLLLSPSVSQKSFEWSAKEGISCANKANAGCSFEAQYSLNRIVGNILGISYQHLSPPPTSSTQARPPPPPPSTTTTTETPPPPPKRWYEYITQPFISAWQTIKSWFGY